MCFPLGIEWQLSFSQALMAEFVWMRFCRTSEGSGCIGIMEKKMETTMCRGLYSVPIIGIIACICIYTYIGIV